jgi:hypothetical protein
MHAQGMKAKVSPNAKHCKTEEQTGYSATRSCNEAIYENFLPFFNKQLQKLSRLKQ